MGSDTEMAWPFLCTYLRGRSRILEPPLQYKNASTPLARIANTVTGEQSLCYSFAFDSQLFQTDFRLLFGKCEIKANALMEIGFLPDSVCKYT